MANLSNPRLAAILWFVASGVALTAALIGYSGGEGIEWPSLAATAFMAAMGWSALRRSKSSGGRPGE